MWERIPGVNSLYIYVYTYINVCKTGGICYKYTLKFQIVKSTSTQSDFYIFRVKKNRGSFKSLIQSNYLCRQQYP